MDYRERKLREEVEFWRSLIEEWDPKQSESVRVRMREALNYAESKLACYHADMEADSND